MRKSKFTNLNDCVNEIKQMGFWKKCQTRLDHETAFYLRSQGYTLHPQKKFNRKRISSIGELINRSLTWVKFFLESPLSIWDDLCSESAFRFWLENVLFDKVSLTRKKRPKPPLSRNNLDLVFRGGAYRESKPVKTEAKSL